MNNGVNMLGVAKALARLVERDPRVLFDPVRRDYWSEIDSWELRFMSVTGKSREEVYEFFKTLPTTRMDGKIDPLVLRPIYSQVRQGVALEDIRYPSQPSAQEQAQGEHTHD